MRIYEYIAEDINDYNNILGGRKLAIIIKNPNVCYQRKDGIRIINPNDKDDFVLYIITFVEYFPLTDIFVLSIKEYKE